MSNEIWLILLTVLLVSNLAFVYGNADAKKGGLALFSAIAAVACALSIGLRLGGMM